MFNYMKKYLLSLFCLITPIYSCFSTPVSREYVDEVINNIEKNVIGTAKAYYLYDNSDTYFSSQVMNSKGQLFKVVTEFPLGGYWSINQTINDQVYTIKADFSSHDDYFFYWCNSEDSEKLNVIYCLTSGVITVSSKLTDDSENRLGYYKTDVDNNPLKNTLQNFTYTKGYNFTSLEYQSQGVTTITNKPYDSFVSQNTYDKDRDNTVTSITIKDSNNKNTTLNQQLKGDISINIPDVTKFATTDYINSQISDSLIKTDLTGSKNINSFSIVGRIKTLEQTSQAQQQSVVNYVWSDDMSNILNAYGTKYKTIFYPFGYWVRTTVANPDVNIDQIGLTNAVETITDIEFSWSLNTSSSGLTYNNTTGEVKWQGNLIGKLQVNLNPKNYDDLGCITNETDKIIYTFKKRQYSIDKKTGDTAVFNSELPNKTVTSIAYSQTNGYYDTYTGGSIIYRTDKITLPNYSLDYLNKFMYKDMYSWSTNKTQGNLYKKGSIVERIWQLENGGDSVVNGFIKTPMKDYIKNGDLETITNNDSIVGNLYKIRSDYTTTNDVKNISGDKTSNVVSKVYIKDIGFYDKTEVDSLISEKIEQKRGDYLYDNVDKPTQVVDSKGNLYYYGIEDLGGSYYVTKSTGEKDTLGQYFYSGYDSETTTYSWTNINNKTIWYNSSTGVIGDPNSTAEGSDESKNLNPTNCAVLPDIETDSTTAKFTPQKSLNDSRYTESYDRFALNSELDKALINTKSTISQLIPTLNIAIDNPGRSFNSFFTINGNNLTPGSTVNSFINLSNGNNIQFPINNLLFDKVDIKFTMQITLPDYGYYHWWTIPFLKSSNTEFLPTISFYTTNGQINKDIEFTYPGDTSLKISDTSLYKSGCNLDVHLILNKVDGSLSFSISNTVNSLNYEYTGFSNVDRKDNETLTLGMNYTDATLLLVSDSLVVTFDDDTIKQLVISEPSEYTKVTKLNAAKELGDTTQINLKLASTTDYGVVKPDGTTIKINDDGLLVTGDVGASEDDMKKILTNTKITELTSSETESIVSHINLNISDISSLKESLKTLQESNNEILKQLKEYNEKLDNALNGETN